MTNDKVEHKRDPEIQRIFENADDSIMGILGYNIFLNVVETIPHYTKIQMIMPDVHTKHAREQIEEAIQRGYLPSDLAEELKEYHINNFCKNTSFIPNTSIWTRDYNKHDLISSVSEYLRPFSLKLSFVYMLSVVEDALVKFIKRLIDLKKDQYDMDGKLISDHRRLKMERLISWSYNLANINTITIEKLRNDRYISFRYLDLARWIRNKIIHNRGLISEKYEDSRPFKFSHYEEKIDLPVDKERITREFKQIYDLEPNKRIEPIINVLFQRFSSTIMDILFLVHESIQENFFDVRKAYNYKEERKRISFRELMN